MEHQTGMQKAGIQKFPLGLRSFSYSLESTDNFNFLSFLNLEYVGLLVILKTKLAAYLVHYILSLG